MTDNPYESPRNGVTANSRSRLSIVFLLAVVGIAAFLLLTTILFISRPMSASPKATPVLPTGTQQQPGSLEAESTGASIEGELR